MSLVFNDCVLDLDRREFHRGAEFIKLEPKVFDVLALLVSNQGRVVSKDQILDTVWKDVSVNESAIAVRINAARKAVGDSGEKQQIIETVHGRGFKFKLPVRDSREASKPSIAVLPFSNFGGADYFVDGFVAEITTALAQTRKVHVAARNSSFTYKGKAVDVRQVGEDLKVRYVLEGSVSFKGDDRVTVQTQLADTSEGFTQWVAKFEGNVSNIFDLQEDVAGKVAARIVPGIHQAEIKRKRYSGVEIKGVYDLYLQALSLFHEQGRESLEEAIVLLKRASQSDKHFALAPALLCECRIVLSAQGWRPLAADEEVELLGLAERAIALGRDEPDVLCWAALGLSSFGRAHDRAASHVDRALELNPYSVDAWQAKGWIPVTETSTKKQRNVS